MHNLQVTTQNSLVQTRTQHLTDHCSDCLFLFYFYFIFIYLFFVLFLFYLFLIAYVYLFIFSTMSCFLKMYDDYMLCKVTLGVLKGASKLNVLLLLLFIIIRYA